MRAFKITLILLALLQPGLAFADAVDRAQQDYDDAKKADKDASKLLAKCRADQANAAKPNPTACQYQEDQALDAKDDVKTARKKLDRAQDAADKADKRSPNTPGGVPGAPGSSATNQNCVDCDKEKAKYQSKSGWETFADVVKAATPLGLGAMNTYAGIKAANNESSDYQLYANSMASAGLPFSQNTTGYSGIMSSMSSSNNMLSMLSMMGNGSAGMGMSGMGGYGMMGMGGMGMSGMGGYGMMGMSGMGGYGMMGMGGMGMSGMGYGYSMPTSFGYGYSMPTSYGYGMGTGYSMPASYGYGTGTGYGLGSYSGYGLGYGSILGYGSSYGSSLGYGIGSNYYSASARLNQQSAISYQDSLVSQPALGSSFSSYYGSPYYSVYGASSGYNPYSTYGYGSSYYGTSTGVSSGYRR